MVSKFHLFILLFFLTAGQGLFALQLTDYSYRLTNGIRITPENGWRKTEATQDFTNGVFVSNRGAVQVDFTVIGDLVDDHPEITLSSSSKPKNSVKLNAGTPSADLNKGKYNAFIKFPLQLKNGTITFRINDVIVKENTLTLVRVTINDIQVAIVEAPGEGWKQSEYNFTTYWAKGNMDGGGYTGYPTVFKAKDHFQMVTPVEIASDTKAKMRPGTYDFYLDTDISKAKFRYTCWIENVKMESNTTYQFRCNLNGSRVRTGIADDNPKQIGFYPPGTAAKQKPRVNKKLIRYTVVEPWKSAVCPTGTYDVLLSFDYGAKMEWRENVVFKYGEETVIK